MPGSTNFLRFDEDATNLQSDTDYNNDAQRTGGVVGGLAKSALHNKLFYQVSVMVAALGQTMADAGETVADSGYTALIQSIKDTFIQAVVPSQKMVIGFPPQYASASEITIPAGLAMVDSTNAKLIEFATAATVDIATVGANGRDAGSEGTDEWWYVYVIDDSTGTNPPAGLLSLVNEAATGSITMPAGYDLKRQTRVAVRNDGSGDFIPFIALDDGWVFYNVEQTTWSSTSTFPTSVLVNGNAGATFTNVTCTDYIPPIAEFAEFYCTQHGNSGWFRPDGASHEGTLVSTNGSAGTQNSALRLECPAQVIEYKENGTKTNISIIGWKNTKVA